MKVEKIAKTTKAAWSELSDAQKHWVWQSMTARQQAAARDQISDRDARMLADADALASVRALGAVPDGCSAEIINAPARGPLVKVQPFTLHIDAKGEAKRMYMPFRSGHPARVGDVWDKMEEQARKTGGGFLFEVGQVEAAREYRDVYERYHSSGLSGSSLEVLSGKSGAGSVSEAVHQDAERLRYWHRVVGPGLAKDVRRVRPSHRGKRVAIRHLDLVERVCVGQMTVVEVLLACGWQKYGEAVKDLRGQLCLCLDRMRGAAPRYRPGDKM